MTWMIPLDARTWAVTTFDRFTNTLRPRTADPHALAVERPDREALDDALAAGAIADIIEYVITRPAHLAINDVMVLSADHGG
jgi:NADP-dependent 3-hydroxy acid dehydrogenase YdfG